MAKVKKSSKPKPSISMDEHIGKGLSGHVKSLAKDQDYQNHSKFNKFKTGVKTP